MKSHTKFIYLFVVSVCLINLSSVVSAEQATASPRGIASSAEEGGNELSFPYIAEITGDNVNIRSGPGTNYYHCGKLDSGDRVKVVASKYSWSHIVPPAGSFSWISKQYVSVDSDNSRIGTVTGDSVRVYAGSNFLKPIHSTTVQLKLDKGDKVELTGEEMDDYYKITPPTGAYLWVLTKYTKPLGAVVRERVSVKPKARSKVDVPADVPTVVVTNSSVESKKLKEYYVLAKQIKAEQTRPITQQDYTEIKKALAEIANNKAAGKAARYSEFAIKQIGRYELAYAADKAVQFQDLQLQNVFDRIEKARAAELAQVPKLGGFVVIGQFQTSQVFGPEQVLKHYRIIDNTGQTVCYAVPEGLVSQVDFSKYVGRKVGLVGTVEPYPQTKCALVRFTGIAELK